MSFLRLRLKQENMILRCPGLKPSTMLGIERSRSARENRISSWGYSTAHYLNLESYDGGPGMLAKVARTTIAADTTNTSLIWNDEPNGLLQNSRVTCRIGTRAASQCDQYTLWAEFHCRCNEMWQMQPVSCDQERRGIGTGACNNLVDELLVWDEGVALVQVGAGDVVGEPRLAVLDLLLAEGHADGVPVLFTCAEGRWSPGMGSVF